MKTSSAIPITALLAIAIVFGVEGVVAGLKFLRKVRAMKIRVLIALAANFGSAPLSWGMPAPCPDWLDDAPGSITTEWVAPFVHQVREKFGDVERRAVVWYDASHRVLRELEVPYASEQSVTEDTAEGWTIHGIAWDGQLQVLVSESARRPSVAASRSGTHRVLVRRDELNRRWLSSLAPATSSWSRGPFRTPPEGYEWRVLVGVDGWVGLIKGTTDSLEAVLLDPSGNEALQSRIEERFTMSGVGKNRILLRGSKYRFLSPDHPPVEFPWARRTFVLWLPPEHVGLFNVEDERLQAIDCTSGDALWSIPIPGPRCDWWPMTIEEIDGLLFVHAVVGDSATIAAREPDVPKQVIVAYDAASGKSVASWESRRSEKVDLSHRIGLQRRGDKLWFVETDRFARIDLSDVRAQENGWWQREGSPLPEPPLLLIPARSDLVWQPSGSPREVPPEQVLQTVRRMLGGMDSLQTRYEAVRLRDAGAYGLPEHYEDVWLTTTTIEIYSETLAERMQPTLHLAIRRDGELLAAFTESSPMWFALSDGTDNLEDGSSNPCEWELGSTGAFTHTVVDLLLAMWEKCGVRADHAGQVVLRPRIALCSYPARHVNGKRVPLYPMGPLWFIDVRGSYLESRGYVSASTRIILYDHNLEGSASYRGGIRR